MEFLKNDRRNNRKKIRKFDKFKYFFKGWLYGIKRIREDVYLMLKTRPGIYWTITFAIVPVLTFVSIFSKTISCIFNNNHDEFQGRADHIHYQTCAKPTGLSQRLCVSSRCPSYRLDNRSCCCCAFADIFHTSFDREKAKINERIASRGFKIIF